MRCFQFVIFILISGSQISLCACAEEEDFASGKVVQAVVDCLERVPLTRKPVDDAMSAKWFTAFLDRLDPKRMYFLQADEDEFRSFEKRLGELAEVGDFGFPRQVCQRYKTRVTQAAAFAQHWLSRLHDYSVDENLPIQFDRYARGTSELRERWRLRIKFELLVEKVHGIPREEAEAQLRSRYERIARDARAVSDERLCEIFLNSLAQCYDPHCEYLGPTYRASFNIGPVRSYTLGISLRKSRGEWVIHSIDPSFSNSARIDRDPIGWHLLAIRRVSGPLYDIVEMSPQDLHHLISAGPLERDTQVILELMDPVTFSRKSIRWVRLPC